MATLRRYRTPIAIFLLLSMFIFPDIAIASDEVLRDTGNPLERAIALLVNAIAKVFEVIAGKGAGLKPLSELIFMTGLSEAEKSVLPWSGSQITYLKKFFNALTVVTFPIILVSIAVTGYRFILTPVSPTQRKEGIEGIKRWFMAMGIIILAPYFIEFLLIATRFLIEGINLAFSYVVSGGSTQDLEYLDPFAMELVTGSVLGTALVRLGFVLIYVYLNVLYIIRMAAISVMFVFTPLMAMLWAINRNETAINVWLGELASNAFMPVAHALTFCVILLLVDVKNVSEGGTWFTILILLYTLIPLSEALRNSMQSILTRASGIAEEGLASKALGGATGGVSRLGAATLGLSKIGGASPKISSVNKIKDSKTEGFLGQSKQPAPKENILTEIDNKGMNQQTRTQQQARISSTSGVRSNAPARAIPQNAQTVSSVPKTVDTGKYKATVQRIPQAHPRQEKITPTLTRGVTVGRGAGRVIGMAASVPLSMLGGIVPGGEALTNGTAKAINATTQSTGAFIGSGVELARASLQNRSFSKGMEQVTGSSDIGEGSKRMLKSSYLAGREDTQGVSDYLRNINETAPVRAQPPIKNLPRRTPNMVSGSDELFKGKYKVQDSYTGTRKVKPPQQEQPSKENTGKKWEKNAWRSKPMTGKQEYTLKEIGKYNPSYNRGQASDQIGGKVKYSQNNNNKFL